MFPSTIPKLTALAGGGRSGATQLPNDVAILSVVASAGDSAVLPQATTNVTVRVIHLGAQPASIYGYASPAGSTDQIAGAASFSQPAGTIIDYFCSTTGQWTPDFKLPNGTDSSLVTTQFGSATITMPPTPFAQFTEEGNLYRNVGNPISSNGANTTDDILDGFVLPANCFDVANRGLQLTFQGKYGATANNKRIKIWANPTIAGATTTNGVISGGTVTAVGSGVLLFDSGVQTGNAVGWSALVQLFKYGAAGSNTQFSQNQPINGTTHGGISNPVFSTLVENAPINIVVTGSSPTTGAAADVILNFTEINAMN